MAFDDACLGAGADADAVARGGGPRVARADHVDEAERLADIGPGSNRDLHPIDRKRGVDQPDRVVLAGRRGRLVGRGKPAGGGNKHAARQRIAQTRKEGAVEQRQAHAVDEALVIAEGGCRGVLAGPRRERRELAHEPAQIGVVPCLAAPRRQAVRHDRVDGRLARLGAFADRAGRFDQRLFAGRELDVLLHRHAASPITSA
ncbi:MAG: hypothetical protein H6891_04310 [Brucellaceae bacterium]|nr:hypothetical protein [Brucellaceae bacterium]